MRRQKAYVKCRYKRFTWRFIIDEQNCAETSGNYRFPFIRNTTQLLVKINMAIHMAAMKYF